MFELSETQDKLLERAVFYLSQKVKLLHHFITNSGLIYELNRFENLQLGNRVAYENDSEWQERFLATYKALMTWELKNLNQQTFSLTMEPLVHYLITPEKGLPHHDVIRLNRLQGGTVASKVRDLTTKHYNSSSTRKQLKMVQVEDEYYSTNQPTSRRSGPKYQDPVKPPLFFGDRLYAPVKAARAGESSLTELPRTTKNVINVEKTYAGISVRSRVKQADSKTDKEVAKPAEPTEET